MLIKSKRVDWIDVAKAIGIFTIYMGHFMDLAGHAYPFVFQFHVPLFFFLAGCTENFNSEKSILKNLYKTIKSVLVPTLFFAFFALFIWTVYNNWGIRDIEPQLIVLAQGIIRNKFIGNSLWFLTCFFSIKVLFILISKVKYKSIMLIISFCMYLMSFFVILPKPIFSPHWYFNFDSAFYYINFFIVGYVLFPYIQKLLSNDSLAKKIFLTIFGILVSVYAYFAFFGNDIIDTLIGVTVPDYINHFYKAYILIGFILLISYMLKNVKFLAKIGRNTLGLCGNEDAVKVLVPLFASLIGLNINVSNPLGVYIYAALLILVSNYILLPLEQPIINYLKYQLDSLADFLIHSHKQKKSIMK